MCRILQRQRMNIRMDKEELHCQQAGRLGHRRRILLEARETSHQLQPRHSHIIIIISIYVMELKGIHAAR